MIQLVEVAAEIQAYCQSRGWKFCFIGGLALQRWGEPRLTEDVDLTLLTGFGEEETFIHGLLEKFQARIENAAAFALRNRVLLLKSKIGIGIDIALGALPFEKQSVLRASDYEYAPGIFLHTCSAEDLIVSKVFADRDHDWIDVKMILVRQGKSNLDWRYILRQLKPLCALKGQPEIVDRLMQMRKAL